MARRQRSETRGGMPLAKRQRLEAVEGEGHQKSRTSPGSPQCPSVHLDHVGNVQLTVEPMSAILARYRAWKKAGAWHQSVCWECRQPDNLQHCVTCPRSYHQSCWHQRAVFVAQPVGPPRRFCEVCVDRNWHVEPPPTPPASPLPSDEELHDSVQALPERSTSDPEKTDSGLTGSDQNQDTTRVLEATSPEPSQPQAPPITQPPVLLQSTTPVSAGRGRGNRSSLTGAAAPRRKSRYATLPTEVDSALAVLYREVEEAAQLRRKVTDLEAEVSRLRQNSELREKELVLARKAAEMARASRDEVAQLRAESSQKQDALREAAALKMKNESLGTELQDTQKRLEETTQTLQKWKEKLSTLIAD